MPSFGTPGQLFKISPLSAQICHSLGAHAKFRNPTTTPSVRISNEPGEKKERETNANYSGHLRFCLQPKGSARTPLGPIDVEPGMFNNEMSRQEIDQD